MIIPDRFRYFRKATRTYASVSHGPVTNSLCVSSARTDMNGQLIDLSFNYVATDSCFFIYCKDLVCKNCCILKTFILAFLYCLKQVQDLFVLSVHARHLEK